MEPLRKIALVIDFITGASFLIYFLYTWLELAAFNGLLMKNETSYIPGIFHDLYGFTKKVKDECGYYHANSILHYRHIGLNKYLVFNSAAGQWDLSLAEYFDELDIGKEDPESLEHILSGFKFESREHLDILGKYYR